MAESQDAMMAQLDGIQTKLRQALAAGHVPEDKEIQLRTFLAQTLHQRYKQFQRANDLSDAIEHLETVVRRLPPDSPEIPQHLDELSFMKVSEHELTQALRPLNEAILYGVKAKDVALRMDLLTKDSNTYFSILNNLGYAQSHRWVITRQSKDLDDAMQSAQEILSSAPKESTAYGMALVNLASRTRLRYNTSGDVADREEAIRLINQVLERAEPGSIDRTLTIIQLSQIAFEKYKEEKDMKDLDNAIKKAEEGLNDLPYRYEKKGDLLSTLCQMYCDRFNVTKDLEDAGKVIMHSKTRVYSAMPSHPSTGT